MGWRGNIHQHQCPRRQSPLCGFGDRSDRLSRAEVRGYRISWLRGSFLIADPACVSRRWALMLSTCGVGREARVEMRIAAVASLTRTEPNWVGGVGLSPRRKPRFDQGQDVQPSSLVRTTFQGFTRASLQLWPPCRAGAPEPVAMSSSMSYLDCRGGTNKSRVRKSVNTFRWIETNPAICQSTHVQASPTSFLS